MAKTTKKVEKVIVSTKDFSFGDIKTSIDNGTGKEISPEKLIGALYTAQFQISRYKEMEAAIKKQIEIENFDEIVDALEKSGKISPGATPEIELNIEGKTLMKTINISVSKKETSDYDIADCIYDKEVFDFLPDKYKIFEDPKLNKKALVADFKDGSIPDSIASYIKETKGEKVGLRALNKGK